MDVRYRGMGRDEIDIAYDNRAVVPGWQSYLNDWRARSKVTYRRATVRDLAYGSGPRQKMDLFLVDDPSAPVCLFLHGGYWQWNDKEGQAFVADGILGQGMSAVIGGYTLAPDATMPEICSEATTQVAFLSAELTRLGRDGDRMLLAGISTGAHLMAGALHLPCVCGALLISGIYDLEPIRLSSLNAPLNMDWAEARRHSPLHHVPAAMPPVVLAHGSLERPEIQRQSADYFAALQSLGHSAALVPVENTDHFSVLEELSDDGGRLGDALATLASGRGL